MKHFLLLTLLPIINLSGISNLKHTANERVTNEKTLKIGKILPKANVKLENYAGAKVNMRSAGRENGLLIIFSSNTCITVLENHLRIMSLANYAIQNKIGVMILNSNEKNRDGSDSREVMKAYAEELGFKWLYVVDHNSEIANAFGANYTPECFLFNKLGKLMYRGGIDDSPHNEQDAKEQYLKKAIREMADGKSVTLPETTPTGCAIKRK